MVSRKNIPNQGMETTTTFTDPLDLVRSLDADQIAELLDQLAAQTKALRVLLRSARAHETAQRRPKKRKGEADEHI